MMTAVGKNFYNVRGSRFLIIMQNVKMATNGKCNSRLNPIAANTDALIMGDFAVGFTFVMKLSYFRF